MYIQPSPTKFLIWCDAKQGFKIKIKDPLV